MMSGTAEWYLYNPMKNLTLLFSITLFLASCSPPKPDYSFEDKLMACYYQELGADSAAVKTALGALEQLLIEHQMLADGSGESCMALIQKIGENQDWRPQGDELGKAIASIPNLPAYFNFKCPEFSFQEIDSSALQASRLYDMMTVVGSTRHVTEINPSVIAKMIAELFQPEDFEHPFYRAYGLIALANMIRIDEAMQGLQRKLPPSPDIGFEVTDPQNRLVVLVGQDDRFFVNEQLVELSEVRTRAKAFILETAEQEEIELPLIGKQMQYQGVIFLQNDVGTSYEAFIAVQNELAAAYREVRNSYAQQFFSTEYENLHLEKVKIIRKLVPQRISEAEPAH